MLRFCTPVAAVIRGSVTRYHRHRYEIHFHFITRSWSISQTRIGNNLYQFNELQFNEFKLSNVCRVGNDIHLAMEWKTFVIFFLFFFVIWNYSLKETFTFLCTKGNFFFKRSFEISISYFYYLLNLLKVFQSDSNYIERKHRYIKK